MSTHRDATEGGVAHLLTDVLSDSVLIAVGEVEQRQAIAPVEDKENHMSTNYSCVTCTRATHTTNAILNSVCQDVYSQYVHVHVHCMLL